MSSDFLGRFAPQPKGATFVLAILAAACSQAPAGNSQAPLPSLSSAHRVHHPTPSPSPTQTPSPTPKPSPTPTPSGTVVWKAGDPTLGKWEIAYDHQCGTPVNVGTEFDFTLVQNGTNCGRNQANPLTAAGGNVMLTPGVTYTWTWHEIDGPPPGMGPDADARSLVWQIHGYEESDSPCTSLNFINGPDQVSGPQMWGFFTCAGLVWSGSYTPGESDDWTIVAKISSGSDGDTKLYRNGKLQVDSPGANYHNSPTNQAWWNFGPYKWRWELPGGGGSTMTTVAQTFQSMLLTSSP